MSFEDLKKRNDDLITLEKTRKIVLPIVIIAGIVFVILMFVLLSFETTESYFAIMIVLIILDIIVYPILSSSYKNKYDALYKDLEKCIMNSIGIKNWEYTTNRDTRVYVKSKQGVMNYTDIKFFKENDGYLQRAKASLDNKEEYKNRLSKFIKNNEYKVFFMYPIIEKKIKNNLNYTDHYYVLVRYTSPAGRSNYQATLSISRDRINELLTDKSLLMSKTEYNRYVKEHERELLEKKQHEYYERVNRIIDVANNKDVIIIKKDVDELDELIASLFDRTVNSIKKVKTVNSEEWDVIDKFTTKVSSEVGAIVKRNKQILDYYNSSDFLKIKEECETLMNTQREFNEYIDEKVKSISNLFGQRPIRDETVHEDEYNYVHPYKKVINPFIAELSSNVFASAENNPLEYVVKYFYPYKEQYPEQIQKLHLLIEELETLKDAKQIIENHKKEIQQYLTEVPKYVMDNDEEGFYSRLGFATIDENVLTVEYRFSYTSNSGKAQRYFPVPMTEETIVNLIKMLESKLTITAFTREQRALMTSKLRLQIMERDNYTCKCCGNSTHNEPNLLLEIDHIIPVSKGGVTEEGNLQTLCWKCNRQKGSKLL